MVVPGETEKLPVQEDCGLNRTVHVAAMVDNRAGADGPSAHSNGLRISIFLKLASLCTLLVVGAVLTISVIILNRQKAQFLAQLISLGENTARIVARNAADKLLGEEDLSLFQLTNDAAAGEQVVFALITDHKSVIKAHSKMDEVGKSYWHPEKARPLKDGADVKTSFIPLNGEEALLFDAPVTFKDVKIGQVKIAISLRSIEDSIRKAKISIAVLTILITLAGILLSFALSMYFSRPIRQLGDGTRALANGKLAHRVLIQRNDEFGDLAEDFNKMAAELELKEKIKDSFGRYVTPEILEMIMANPDSRWMKGSEVEASVVFVDIRGFTALSEEREPEQLVGLLNDYFTLVTEVIVRNGGHLNKFVGDEAMAVFGAPAPNRLHADAALKTAVEIQQEMACFVPKMGVWDKRVQVGIGINSGGMIAGNLGSEIRMEYTVIGDNVNVASRLTSLAKGGQILLSGNTFDLLEKRSAFDIREKGKVSVKGRKTEIAIYSVAA